MALLLTKPARATQLTLTWNLAGKFVNVPVGPGNGERTYWQGDVSKTSLITLLSRQTGQVELSLNSQLAGEASLANAPNALRSALGRCRRL